MQVSLSATEATETAKMLSTLSTHKIMLTLMDHNDRIESVQHMSMFEAYALSREYTCAEASYTSNEAASVCCNALVCTTNFDMCKQPRFGSCTARPEPLTVGPSKWALAKANAALVGSVVSMLHLASTHSHFSFRGKSHCGHGAAHRGCLIRCAVCLSACVFPALGRLRCSHWSTGVIQYGADLCSVFLA